MKKVFSVLLCILLIASTLITGYAANSPAYTSSIISAEAGKEITVPVSIENNSGIISLRLQVIYDEAVLELISVEDKGLLEGFTDPSETKNSPYVLRWSNGTAVENNTANGEIALLTFKVAEDIDTAFTEIKIEHVESNKLRPDYDFDYVVFENAVQTIEFSHTFTNYVSDNNATCTADGTKTAICDICKEAKDTITDKGSVLGHNLGAFATVKAPGCLTKGQSQAKCSRCNYTEPKDIAATGHKDANKDNRCDSCKTVIDPAKETTKPTAAPVAPQTTVPSTKEEKPAETKVKKPAKVKIKKPKSTKKKQIVVTWTAIKTVNGYQVEYSTSKKFTKKTTKTKLIKKAKTAKTTLKKLNSGKKYFIRIKAYKTVDGKKIYGSYSKVMNVKVK